MAERIQQGSAWTCSACGGFIRSDAPHCKHCKAVFTGEGVASQAAQPTKRTVNPLVAIGVIALLILGGLFWLVSTGPAVEGQTGRLNSGGGNILAARDRATFDRLGSMTTADLAGDPNVVVLASGTPVLVLSVEPPRSRVRVVSSGEEVWVLTTWVVK